MKIVQIALRNIFRHTLSSLVIFIVFVVSAFVLFWTYGFTSYMQEIHESFNRASYGDITFKIAYADETDLSPIEALPEVEKIYTDRELYVMIDGEGGSSVQPVIELTEENMDNLYQFVRPHTGRLPEKASEIVINDYKDKGLYKVGDVIYLTTSTPDKILNTVRFKIVGINHSSAFKAVGYAYTIAKPGMDALINSSTQTNLFYVDLKDSFRSEKQMITIQNKMKTILDKQDIKIKDTFRIHEVMKKLEVFGSILLASNTMVLLIIFPLVGAVIAAIAWMYAFRRRKELWTYIALGMNDKKLYQIFLGEYLLVALSGGLGGIFIGYLTAWYAEATNAWLMFSYTFSGPLRARFGGIEIAIVLVFFVISVLLWGILPVRKIIRQTPFSY